MGTQEHWTAAQYQEYLRQRAKGNNKYHAVKVEVDGTVYASQSESRRAKELHLLERHGLVRNLREQVPYELIPAGVGKYRKERSVVYKADFVYEVCQPDGTWKQVVEDTKGAKTKEYIIKRKLMLYIHGISVKETDK
jgi:hypothetical protein